MQQTSSISERWITTIAEYPKSKVTANKEFEIMKLKFKSYCLIHVTVSGELYIFYFLITVVYAVTDRNHLS